MRHRLDRANRYVAAVGVGVGVVIAHVTNELLIKPGVSAPVLVIVAGVIIVGTSEFLRGVFDGWFLNWRPVRQLILGRYYVEGSWIDRMVKDDKVIGTGITRIQPDGQSVIISGEDDSEAGAMGRYTTELHTLGWPCVGYMYRYSRSDTDGTASGLVEMQFEPRSGPPRRYTGDYVDPTDGRKVTFEGWRIEDRDLLRRIDDPAERTEAMRLFWDRVDAARKAAVERDIAAPSSCLRSREADCCDHHRDQAVS